MARDRGRVLGDPAGFRQDSPSTAPVQLGDRLSPTEGFMRYSRLIRGLFAAVREQKTSLISVKTALFPLFAANNAYR